MNAKAGDVRVPSYEDLKSGTISSQLERRVKVLEQLVLDGERVHRSKATMHELTRYRENIEALRKALKHG